MKRFLFWLVRLLVQPAMSPGVPAWLQRRWIDTVGLILLGPRRYKAQRQAIAGVAATRIVPAKVDPGRGVLYLHGGGYVVGSAHSHTKLAAWLGQAAKAQVWLPEYRLAPEHASPVALKDALAVYGALLAAAQDPSRLVIAGDSAGGGLALATAIAIRQAGLPPPAALILLSPWTDLSLSGETIRTHATRDAMLKPAWLRWCADAYRGAARADDPGCSPLFADLRGLPPVLIHVGSEEILLSDAERLARRLHATGGTVELRRYDGVGHVFQLHAGVLHEADDSIRAAGQFIERSFTPPPRELEDRP